MAGVLLAMLAAAAAPAWTPLPDAELADMRGGFSLPGGIEIALTVRSDTSVNGALLLRSVFSAVGNTPTLQVLAPAKGQELAAASSSDETTAAAASGAQAGGVTAAGSAGDGNALAVQFDRQTGVVFVPAPVAAVIPTVSVTSGAAAVADAADEGLSVVPVVAGGPAVETAGGLVSIVDLRDGARIRLEGAGLDISHLVGAAFGSAVANTGSDRIIDTTTTIGVDLGSAGPEMLGSAMFRVENVAIDAARLGIR